MTIPKDFWVRSSMKVTLKECCNISYTERMAESGIFHTMEFTTKGGTPSESSLTVSSLFRALPSTINLCKGPTLQIHHGCSTAVSPGAHYLNGRYRWYSMFHQVQVSPVDAAFLRFLWWPNGDTMQDLQEYRKDYQVHLFGAVSSLSCARFLLKMTADDDEK